MRDANEYVVCLECSCGTAFEPEKIVVDRYGEEWAVCPKCKALIRLAAKD
jgi:NAD-dependent SIR2 family protein deacetylase